MLLRTARRILHNMCTLYTFSQLHVGPDEDRGIIPPPDIRQQDSMGVGRDRRD
jgi:hypothetical protein